LKKLRRGVRMAIKVSGRVLATARKVRLLARQVSKAVASFKATAKVAVWKAAAAPKKAAAAPKKAVKKAAAANRK